MFVDPDDYISEDAVQILYERLLSDGSDISAESCQKHEEQVNWHAQGSEAEGGAGRGLDHSENWKKVIQLLVSTPDKNPERKGRELSGDQIMLH